MSKQKLLWLGDAVMSTGFAKCTHAACDSFHAAGWDVHVLGINYPGDPHDKPYAIYPAARAFRGEDAFGVKRVGEFVAELKPDFVCVLQDPWNVPVVIESVRRADKTVPITGWIAVDGLNCRGTDLNGLDLAVFWTAFGENEAREGGLKIPSAVVPLGVDIDVFKPCDRAESRRSLQFPAVLQDAFVLGSVGRNQPRKRLDLMIAYFAEWIKNYDVPDAVLMFHVAPTGDLGWHIPQLVRYYGLKKRAIIFIPEIGLGVEEKVMPRIYSSMNIMATTTQGEGWGLCTMESMACGVPNIVPDWSALGEWPEDAVYKVPCTTIAHTPNNINVVGGIADREGMITAFDTLYHDSNLRDEYIKKGLKLVARPEFRWKAVGDGFRQALESIVQVNEPAMAVVA